jgi:long-subunit acyl-CoA synthetase (AMP-forming)
VHLIFTALARHAAERPEAPALILGQTRISWASFARRVAAAAAGFRAGPACVGLALSGPDAVIGDLAATLAGCRVVPVPDFFSEAQVAHVLADAGATLVRTLPEGTETASLDYAGGADRVIYTSGTTGRPKGVILGDRQISTSVLGLAAVLQPTAGDRYLSVLPKAQLLEQICGIFLPVLAGAPIVTCPEGVAALLGGSGPAFARAAEAADPTVTVVVPRQLSLWVAALRAGQARAPQNLRYVAVGGAQVSPALMAGARAVGLPVAEGYGLSEACSVVALTPPGAQCDGSAGRILPGISLRIEAGEIVVAGPTVMAGYLHQPPLTSDWHTGDLGRIEAGRLWVEGRRDALIVRSSGRNIAPEWVEAEALADAAVLAAALVPAGEDLVLVLAPVAPPDIAALIVRLGTLPAYARPTHLLMADPREPGLIRASGTADRAIAARLVASQSAGLLPLAAAAPAEGVSA